MSDKATMEKERKELVRKFSELKHSAEKKGEKLETIRDVFLKAGKEDSANHEKTDTVKCESVLSIKEGLSLASILCSTKVLLSVFLILGTITASAYYIFPSYTFNTLDSMFDIRGPRCAIDNNGFLIEIARPLVRCSMCQHLYEVPIEHNISALEFRKKYAYSSIPVLIKNATSNWSAMETFSFEYLKKLYLGIDGALEAVEDECQFFPYKTEFKTLEDVFNISSERASFKEGEKPWYVGWSNCHSGVKDILRQHYQRPYFLPNDSESSMLDWIFMGGSGLGAFIHLDYVQRPSWQAQISGKKTWTLIPAPECEAQCRTMNVTVHKGDIFVIDTNQWYHATYIHPGEISITIGSEYD